MIKYKKLYLIANHIIIRHNINRIDLPIAVHFLILHLNFNLFLPIISLIIYSHYSLIASIFFSKQKCAIFQILS